MNSHESEALAGILEEAGYIPAAENDTPDAIFFNTCCVREHAESRVFGNVGALKHLKQENPDLIIGVCGCMMQQEGMAKKFANRFPFVDIVFGTKNMYRLPEMLYAAVVEHERSIMIEEEDTLVDDLPQRRNSFPLSYVSIMQGCNNFCSYCIVPYVRGRERSRDPESILLEISSLVKEGYKEVMLLGQNVNSYRPANGCDFPTLLTRIAEETGIERIRFMTSHPKDASKELISVIKKYPNICKSLHLPLQSGSSEILRRMNRKYSREHYLELIDYIKNEIPGIFLSTDIIVGFPGETEEDFEMTMDMMRKVRFDAAYTFIYSPRKGTKAALFDEQIERPVKQSRIARLIDLQGQITYESNLSYVGSSQRVLVEGASKRDENEFCGRTDSGKMVNFKGNFKPGDFVELTITDAKKTTLFGDVK
ncbi:MAG: tRNA (N6-isopentenyl adenosine(37)-C2)-methylthiotransferase MiaB [Christensenellaceae bacterium]|nr:tRNA (N6-isopentenyl adenosine(37)-C2)-methylthiotransferase MiaB [Christensenellaceae bacterium]